MTAVLDTRAVVGRGGSTRLLVRRFLADYARNGANLVLLAVVPVAFVLAAAPSMADAAKVLGGTDNAPAVEAVTAGWSAAFLAGLAMYFQVSASRAADRRLAIAGTPRLTLAAARVATGAMLGVLAAAVAVLTLSLRHPDADMTRVAVGTVAFALVYVGIGAVIAVIAPEPVNGTVILLFVWILDVFFGPALTGSTSLMLRFLPTHYVSLWTVDLPRGHGGPGELTVALVWVAVAVVAAVLVTAGSSRRHRAWHWIRLRPNGHDHGTPSAPGQLATALRMGVRDWARTPVLWVLLVLVPAVFVLLSDAVTPHGETRAVLFEAGAKVTRVVDPADIHGGTMAPIAVASLSALVGIFVVLDARAADRRMRLAGQRGAVIVATRLALVFSAAAIASAASLALAWTVFSPTQGVIYVLGVLVLAVTYALVGVLLGPLFGRVSGTFMAFLLPFLDLGIAQSPMLRGEPASWAHWLPGWGGGRLMLTGALGDGWGERAASLAAAAWLLVLAVGAVAVLRTISGATRSRTNPATIPSEPTPEGTRHAAHRH
jgi:hypothetical protein